MKRLIVPRSQRTMKGTVWPSIVVVVATSAGGAAGSASQWNAPSVADRYT